MKLNQYIALLKGGKSDGEGALTRAYHAIQKTPLLSGVLKTYAPRDEEGENLPSESNILQLRVPVIIEDMTPALIRMFDLTATVDKGNQVATANIVIDDVVLVGDVPVSTLISLEKKLVDFATFVAKLPVLDAAEEWVEADDGLSFKTLPSRKVRTKKIPRNHVKAAATDKHPAQVELYYEDVVVGDWTTVQFSGAITSKQQRELASKVAKLQQAVKIAREEANSTEVTDFKIGAQIFQYLGWTR